jgi:hypothetical protein
MLAIFIIGTWRHRLKGLADFHLAGKNQGTIALTGTFCATIMGASTTIGMAGLGYSRGASRFLVAALRHNRNAVAVCSSG